MKTINIAIDGPSGAGKSTLSRKLAEAFQFIYVDTGALYRAVGLAAIEAGVDIHDAAGIERLLTGLSLELRYTGEGQRVFIGTRDVSGDIRTPEISMAASVVSAQPAVRAFLFALQQDIARGSNVIMDGRDIGTVVLPGADLKIFLTATDEDRAQRRFEELSAKGIAVTYDEVLA
ncbi:MAG: (d)CMP kinase, partial [Oscillospiraceae bacterium]|nr:(d)CMP kinase [Oscillospiraceae bacterium]